MEPSSEERMDGAGQEGARRGRKIKACVLVGLVLFLAIMTLQSFYYGSKEP